MKPSVLLKIAAGIALVEALGHSLLFLTYMPRNGAIEEAVVLSVRSHLFQFGGKPTTYWAMYVGYALIMSVSLLVQSSLLWQLSGIARISTVSVRVPALAFLLGECGCEALVVQYFLLPVAILSHLVLALCLAGAMLKPNDGGCVSSVPTQ